MFDKNEKELLALLVKKELDDFKAEKDTVLDSMSPAFLGAEVKYEEFLKNLLNKLK